MRGVNKVIIVGNLGKDPTTRYLPNGNAITNATIATSEAWKDKDTGQQQEQTEWHRVVFYGKLAEIAGEYLKKGSKVYLEGSLHTRKWQDKQTGQDKYATEIKASTMQMLDSRPQDGGGQRSSQYDEPMAGFGEPGRVPQGQQQRHPAGQRQPAPRGSARDAAPPSDFYDDDIPFD